MNSLKENFYKYISKDISIDKFKEWLYNDKKLEDLIGEEEYIDLISINLNIAPRIEIKKFVKNIFGLKEYYLWHTVRTFQEILEDTNADVVKYAIILTDMYNEQIDNIDASYISKYIGQAFPSELDGYPTDEQYKLWNKEA